MAAQFSRKQLEAAFNIVHPSRGKKIQPICKVISNPGRRNIQCLKTAVEYFTGLQPNLWILGDGRIKIKTPTHAAH